MTEAPVHDWYVEPRELARQEERRGRRHAYASLDPRRTALLVVDLVPLFFNDGNPFIHGVVPRVNRLAAALRERGGLVVWVTPADTEPTAWDVEFFGEQIAAMFTSTGGGGPLPERLWPELEPREGDLHVEKSQPGAFAPGSSDLDALLRERGIDSLVVTGTVTNVCVESTVREAAGRGYRVVLVGDGCAAPSDRVHNATLHTVYRTYGDVRSADDVVGLLHA